jgi:hypothetical protein
MARRVAKAADRGRAAKFVATFLPPLVGATLMVVGLACAGDVTRFDTLQVLWLSTVVNAALVVSVSLIRTYESAFLTLLSVLSIPLWMGIAELCVSQSQPWAIGLCWGSLLACWVGLLWPRDRLVSMLRRRVAANMLISVPTMLIYAGARLGKVGHLPRATVAMTAAIGLSYLLLLPPVSQLLLRAYHEPKVQ